MPKLEDTSYLSRSSFLEARGKSDAPITDGDVHRPLGESCRAVVPTTRRRFSPPTGETRVTGHPQLTQAHPGSRETGVSTGRHYPSLKEGWGRRRFTSS